jgi:hypothetical protein
MLGRLWNAWKRLAHRIGDFQARVLLTAIYAVLILPFGLVVRAFFDPLRIKHRPTKWLERPDKPTETDWAHKQW